MLKRTDSMRQFFCVPTTCFGWDIRKLIFDHTLIEMIPLSNHNLYFGWEIRKLIFSYTLVSGGLLFIVNVVIFMPSIFIFSQRIYAAQLPNSVDWTTFGYSLSGGMDLDDNTYPDVLVGSYEVDKVALLRTRPIIYLHSNITVRPDKLNMSANTEKRCEYDGTAWYCVQIKLCLRYTAEPAER